MAMGFVADRRETWLQPGHQKATKHRASGTGKHWISDLERSALPETLTWGWLQAPFLNHDQAAR